MKTQAGGAAPQRGFEYQDVATAYFFVTDEPSFLQKRPLEVHIEQLGSDFAYYIRFDDYNEEHFFEVKYKGTGEFTLTDFYSVLESFSTIKERYSEEEQSSNYHLITNASFGTRLQSLFDDAAGLRRGTKTWTNVKGRKVYEYRNTNQLVSKTGIDDNGELFKLFSRIRGHRYQEQVLIDGIQNFIRRCNTPGNFRTPSKLLLQAIGQKDHGVIRRNELEAAAEISLEPRSDSANQSNQRSTSELTSDLEELGEDISSTSVETNAIYKAEETTIEIADRVEGDYEDSAPIESRSVSLQEDLSELSRLKEREKALRSGIGEKTNRLIDLVDRSSSDNKGGDEI